MGANAKCRLHWHSTYIATVVDEASHIAGPSGVHDGVHVNLEEVRTADARP